MRRGSYQLLSNVSRPSSLGRLPLRELEFTALRREKSGRDVVGW